MSREAELSELFADCSDVVLLPLVSSQDQQSLLVYCEGLADIRHMQEVVLPQLDQFLAKSDLRSLPLVPLLDDQVFWVERLFQVTCYYFCKICRHLLGIYLTGHNGLQKKQIRKCPSRAHGMALSRI